MKKRVWQWLVRQAFLLLLVIFKRLPLRVAQAWGVSVGLLGFLLSRRYRDVANSSLQWAFGGALSDRQRRTIVRRVFVHFGRATLGEFLAAPFLAPDTLRRLVKADSYAPIDALLARGKGLILVTAHFGNWELLARRAILEGYSVTVVARQGDDAQFNSLTDGLRANGGYEVHARGASPRLLLQRLKQNKIVAILPDQKSDDVFVPFFGKLAGTVAGPAVLALKTGAPIVPMFCPRLPDGTYQVVICPEIDNHSTGDAKADTARIMADINLAVEGMVRRYPGQWLWLHDRWRLPPQEHPAYEDYRAAAEPH